MAKNEDLHIKLNNDKKWLQIGINCDESSLSKINALPAQSDHFQATIMQNVADVLLPEQWSISADKLPLLSGTNERFTIVKDEERISKFKDKLGRPHIKTDKRVIEHQDGDIMDDTEVKANLFLSLKSDDGDEGETLIALNVDWKIHHLLDWGVGSRHGHN